MQPQPIRTLSRTVARWHRYVQITMIAIRSGLGGQPARGRMRSAGSAADSTGDAAVRIRKAARGRRHLREARPMLPTRPDVLPPSVIADLSRLQDGAGPAPEGEIEGVLTGELGVDPKRVSV